MVPSTVEDKDICSIAVLVAFKMDDEHGTISLEEFLDFMGVNNGSDNLNIRRTTLQISVSSVNIIDHTPILGGLEVGAGAGTVTSLVTDSYFELISVSIPAFEDVTASWDKFDVKKLYKFDYKVCFKILIC
jgi:hypothetical protein